MRALIALSIVYATIFVAEARAAEKKLVITGSVRDVAGGIAGKPAAEFKTDDGHTLILRGYSAEDDGELLRLGGFKVRIFAIEGDPGLPATGGYVRVERYEIVDAGGGTVPRIGVLAAIDLEGGRRLIFVGDDGTAELLPAGWLKKMSKLVGSKMWIVGTKKGSNFLVSRHGILRPSRTMLPETEETMKPVLPGPVLEKPGP